MRAGDNLRDGRKRRIGFARVFVTVVGDDYSVRPAAPFSHQSCAWPQTRVISHRNAARCRQFFRQCRKFA